MSEEEIIKETMMLDYSQLVMHNVYMVNENKRLENIIKEVREYIEEYDFITGYYEHNYDDENDTYTHYTVKEELLEILDKTN